MNLIKLRGMIERRLLINFRADPQVVVKLLPEKFRPQLVNGQAVIGICLIRLAYLRTGFMPKFLGLRSENAAHRIAVEWDTPQGLRTGVYVNRRDTSLWLNSFVGGRLFTGRQHQADFDVRESENHYAVAFKSRDDETRVKVLGSTNLTAWPETSVFKNLDESSDFFRRGATGYSPGLKQGQYQGLELQTEKWRAEIFDVSQVESSYFSDEKIFPKGSVQFDHGLIMKNLDHTWRPVEKIISDKIVSSLV